MNKKINPEKFYTPKDIVDLGLMTAKTSDTKRQMLLRYIRNGKLPALNLGSEKKPRYAVQGKNLIAYRDTAMQSDEYETK